MRVGLIGTGNMGNRIGPKVLRGGHALTVYDVRAEAAAALRQAGAQWADSLAQLASSVEVVMTSLPSPSIVEEVVLDRRDGLVTAMAPGSAYIDISTSTPWLAQEIAQELEAVGVDALDAPLSSGGEYIGVGGEDAAFERWRPVLDAMSDHVFHVGGPGTGQAAKLVRQYASFCSFMAEAEALVMAAKAGLNAGAIAGFLGDSVGRTPFRDRVLGSLFARDFGIPGQATATLDIVAKDVNLAVEFARRIQAPAGVGLAVSDTFQRAQAQGWGGQNFWAAVQILEQQAQTELRKRS